MDIFGKKTFEKNTNLKFLKLHMQVRCMLTLYTIAKPTPILQLLKVIEKQLIFGPTYSYTYTNTMKKRLKNNLTYFRGDVEVAGTVCQSQELMPKRNNQRKY